MDMLTIINQNAVSASLQASTKEEALLELAGLLFEDGAILDISEFVADVLLREQEGQTGIGDGIAVPHGKSDFVARNCVAIGKTRHPIPWESIDDKPVSVIFLFAVQRSSGAEEHLRMMATIAKALAHQDICTGFREAESQEDILSLAAEMSKFE